MRIAVLQFLPIRDEQIIPNVSYGAKTCRAPLACWLVRRSEKMPLLKAQH